MATQAGTEIVRTESVMGGEPRIDGTRVTVQRVQTLVERAGESPKAVARRLDVPLPAVYQALAYYHEHEDLFERLRDREEELIEQARADGDLVDVEELLEEYGEE